MCMLTVDVGIPRLPSGAPNGDRYELRREGEWRAPVWESLYELGKVREGERYYIVRPPGGAKKADDFITFDGTSRTTSPYEPTIGLGLVHAGGYTCKLRQNGDLEWQNYNIPTMRHVGLLTSRREGSTAGRNRAVRVQGLQRWSRHTCSAPCCCLQHALHSDSSDV